jgi:hypothetical protein
VRGLDAYIEGRHGPFTAGNPYTTVADDEELLDERLFLPDEDSWGTVAEAEQWEDADEDGRHGGITYTVRLDDRREVTMGEYDLQGLVAEQSHSDVHSHDPHLPEFPCPSCETGCYSVRDNSDAPIPVRVPPSVHDDEGRPVSQCSHCDADLEVRGLAL